MFSNKTIINECNNRWEHRSQEWCEWSLACQLVMSPTDSSAHDSYGVRNTQINWCQPRKGGKSYDQMFHSLQSF